MVYSCAPYGAVPRYAQAHVTHPPACLCQRSHCSVTRSRTSCFFLSAICGIHTSKRSVPFPHRLLHAASASGGWAMTFEEILDQAIAMLQRRGRLTYSTLKRQFHLDDAALDDLKNELIEGQRLAVTAGGTGLNCDALRV